ncbi:unnamed protein product, partial [Owenia fusiformis]
MPKVINRIDERKLLQLAGKMGDQFIAIAGELYFTLAEIETFEASKSDPKSSRFKALVSWQNGLSEGDAQQILAKAMRNGGRSDLAETVEKWEINFDNKGDGAARSGYKYPNKFDMFDVTCYYCGKEGHYSSTCYSLKWRKRKLANVRRQIYLKYRKFPVGRSLATSSEICYR